jgi:pentatricopeptide repeat protein
LEKELETGNELVSLSNKHYTIAIDAWGKSGHTDAARQAEKILEKMLKLNPSVAPTRVTYNALMNAHSRNGDVDRIAELLGFMEDMPSLQPITNDYNVLLSAHAKLGEAREAENVVQRMINRPQELGGRASKCEPDLYSYNMLLAAWSRSNEPNRGKRAEAILEHLCEHSEFEWEPDARTYSAAICAVVRSGEDNILERSERILAQAESNEIDSDIYLESVLLDAYASSKSPGSARRAEELLNKLDEEGIANAVSFNTVIKAWKSSNDPDGPVRAERIVERMKELGIVDTISYSTLIAAYANTGKRDSAERADAILEDMHAMDLTPNIRTLNAGKFRIFGL